MQRPVPMEIGAVTAESLAGLGSSPELSLRTQTAGVVTSFDSIDKVALAKHGLAYLDALCKLTSTCSLISAVLSDPWSWRS